MSVAKQKAESASERLTAARAVHAALARRIDEAAVRRRDALFADDDAGAERADQVMIELRLAAKRAADKIELLLPAAEQELQQRDWPHDIPAARVKLETMRQRKAGLERKPRRDRSAVDQTELDHLVSAVPAMAAHIDLLKRMAA